MSFNDNNEGPGRPKSRTPVEAVKKRIQTGLETKEKVFRIIEASKDGKSTADLRKETGLSRDRIHAICKMHVNEGTLRKTNRHGKYILTAKALGDPAKKGFFFGSKIMNTLPAAEYLSSDNIFCNKRYIKNILNSGDLGAGKQQSSKRDPNIKDKLSLFEFALNVGAIVTLEMIMGIKFAADSSNMSEKDNAAWRWIDNVINPGVILTRFAYIPEIARRLKRSSTKQRPYPFYDMDSKEVACLMQSFNDVFPQVYNQSQDILSDLQSKIDSARQYTKEMVERDRLMETEDPKHTKCGGQLIPETKTRLDGTKVQQCAKCHRWIKMKKPKSTA